MDRRLIFLLSGLMLAGCSGWEVGGSAGITTTGGHPVTIGAAVRDVIPGKKDAADETPASPQKPEDEEDQTPQ